MGDLDDRLAEIRRQQKQAVQAEQQRKDAAEAVYAAAWEKILNAARWALTEYQNARIEPEPIASMRNVIRRGSFGREHYETLFDQVAAGYVLRPYRRLAKEWVDHFDGRHKEYSDHVLMITTDGNIVWCESRLREQAGMQVLNHSVTGYGELYGWAGASHGPLHEDFGRLADEFCNAILMHVGDQVGK